MRIQSVKSNRLNMYLPRKFLPLVWFILQRPPFFARKNGRIGTASDSLCIWVFDWNKKCHKHVTNAPKGIGLVQDTFEER